MSIEDKGSLINSIMRELKNDCLVHDKHWEGGKVFFGLIGQDDDELFKIAKLCGVDTEKYQKP